MKEKTSPLFSTYILDGVQMEDTPFSALYDCLDGNGTVDIPKGPFENIVDEYMDKDPMSVEYDPSQIEQYIQKILHTPFNKKCVDLAHPVTWTKAAINSLLLECIFKEGHFALQDILLMAKWDWNNAPAGNLAAFYDSTVSTGRYLFDLGLKLDRYFIEENRRECTFELSVRSKMSSRRKCFDSITPDPQDWIAYIPFDTGAYKLGGSALNAIVGKGNAAEMESIDPDYIMDCYEVVRELVEDGVITAGIPVGRGGLATAAEKFRGHYGFRMELGGLMGATGEKNIINLLFAEKPGVIVQFKDIDYDYVDSQFILQDIAYYPIGHPDPQMHNVSFNSGCKNSVTSILSALLNH